MGLTSNFSSELNFAITRISGELNDANLRKHIIKHNNENGTVSDLRELADCRTITSLANITVAGTIDNAQLEINRTESLLALLVTDDPLMYGMARAYQQFSEDRREGCKIFKCFDEAIQWLAEDSIQEGKIREFIEHSSKSKFYQPIHAASDSLVLQ